ncbi:MAG TPA: hypothetical protein VF519_18885 [Mycobacteriales bacterium]|jgi:hypothetical protein
MRSTRARSRFAVIAALTPLIAAGGPLVAPAFAASATVAPYQSIGENNVVGPNAGFRNSAQGVKGNTAVLTVGVSSASASLANVEVRLSGFPTGPALVPDRDFAPVDGFAVYKDVSGTPAALGGPDGSFTELDYAQGAVSTGYVVGTPSNNQIPVKISIDGVRATGSSGYFITVHPGNTASTIENRDFVLTVPINGIRFGDATVSPAAAVSTPRITIDSKPPVQPVSTSFTPVNRPPLELQTSPAKEDAYLVSPLENNDADKSLVFLNDGNNVTEANFLRRANNTPAIYVMPTATTAQELAIGDGTGITATSKAARNNQTSDDVFVRAFDKLGNLTTAVRLFDNRSASSGDNKDRSNDVTAPPISGPSTRLDDNVRGVNANNQAAVPVRVLYTAASGTNDHNVTKFAESRLVTTTGGVLSTDPAEITPWGRVADDDSEDVTTHVDARGIGTTGTLFVLQSRVLDAAQNASDTFAASTNVLKDLLPPRLIGVAFENDHNSDGTADVDPQDGGDTLRATWSEPMYRDSIAETGPLNTCASAQAFSANCVNGRLTFPNGGVDWGTNPTVTWSSDVTSILIEVGPTNSAQKRLPAVNDLVRSTEGVQDAVGNFATDQTLSDRFIGAIPPIPQIGAITTADTGGTKTLYNQGRDGYLDQVTVTFPFAIEDYVNKVPANAANFKIIGSDVQTATSATPTSSTTFTLKFGGVMTTGETPQVVYTPPATGGLRAGNADVPAFTRVAVDKAAPAVQLVTTADSNKDGQIDQLVAKYSEPVYRSPLDGEKDGSYRVPGYENYPICDPPITPGNTAVAGDPASITLIGLCPSGTGDTDATPAGKTNNYSPQDAASPTKNTSATGWQTGFNDTAATFNRVLDKAPPVAMTRTTRDLNSDGRIDAIDVVFSEPLDAFSIENARFVVTNRTITSVDLLGSKGVRVNIVPIAPGVVGDTDAKPAIQYTGGPNGGILDASDQRNPVLPEAAPTAASDGAGPAITGACYGTAANNGTCPLDTAADDKMKVFLSEALAADTVAATDFVVEQPSGTNKAATAAYTAGDKFATLTLANNAFDQLKDALVRFPVANAVTDASDPAQGNTQTAAVVAPATPEVGLNLTCPVAATAGYCGATFVNTGAVAKRGTIRYWRLATTAPAANTPDSEYSTEYPAVYPKSGTLPEGKLTLFVSGKDDFGRVAGISPTVSSSIEILRAPVIGSVGVVNTTAPARGTFPRGDTVVDGDNVAVNGRAYSTDVAKWTTNGACLSKHMSVDYRGLTGNSTLGTVAPFSCDLDVSTAPDSRKMSFPFVKVVGTTKYPVGTVLKQSANDPGWIIADGPGGTLVRRPFISVAARRSHMISDASVITVPVSVLNGYSRSTRVGFRDGSVITATGRGYYYVYQSIKRPISAGLLAAWKMPTTQIYRISVAELDAHATGPGFPYGAHAPGTWVRFPDNSIYQITKNALGQTVRRGVTSSWAIRTLVPWGQIYSANHYDRAVPVDASFTRGYRDGTLVKVDSAHYGVVSRTVLRVFANSTTFNTLGFNTANALPFSASYLPRTPTGYQTGTPIDRRKLTNVVIKVTNLAGGTTTATVLPSIGGLWAVGTLDPIPSNWDRSRQ